MKPEDLPDVYRAELDEPGLNALIDDLESLDAPVEVRLKAGPRDRADDSPVTLDEARRRLLERRCRGAQFSYVFEGGVWCDTVLCLGPAFTVVRMQQPTPAIAARDPEA